MRSHRRRQPDPGSTARAAAGGARFRDVGGAECRGGHGRRAPVAARRRRLRHRHAGSVRLRSLPADQVRERQRTRAGHSGIVTQLAHGHH